MPIVNGDVTGRCRSAAIGEIQRPGARPPPCRSECGSKAIKKAVQKCGIAKAAGCLTCRHSLATHRLERALDMPTSGLDGSRGFDDNNGLHPRPQTQARGRPQSCGHSVAQDTRASRFLRTTVQSEHYFPKSIGRSATTHHSKPR
jgi:hypothetical protein